jgi:hypothetical protein
MTTDDLVSRLRGAQLSDMLQSAGPSGDDEDLDADSDATFAPGDEYTSSSDSDLEDDDLVISDSEILPDDIEFDTGLDIPPPSPELEPVGGRHASVDVTMDSDLEIQSDSDVSMRSSLPFHLHSQRPAAVASDSESVAPPTPTPAPTTQRTDYFRRSAYMAHAIYISDSD